MLTNLYGPNDNFDLDKSHVLPAMIRKMYLAKLLDEGNYAAIAQDLQLELKDSEQIAPQLVKYGITKDNQRTTLKLWGSSTPSREFYYE
ncbi:MAG: NAD-dependent epimerase/dehydratase family protein [Sphingobacteriaceae bacterium]|nr:NAD-dependent epimerase/dehydratase family protein [Sphingobacteriaceae bacterium]